MTTLYIIIGIHLLLVLAMFIIAKHKHENKWWQPLSLAIVPFLGPLFGIIVYILTDSQYNTENK